MTEMADLAILRRRRPIERPLAVLVAATFLAAGMAAAYAQTVPLPRPAPRPAAAEPAEQAEPAPDTTAPAAAPTEPVAPDESGEATLNLERELNQRAPLSSAPTSTGLASREDRRVLLDFQLVARLGPGGPPITDGIVWRVFGSIPGADGKLPLIGEAQGGTLNLTLDPGEYLVHAAFGRAAATKRIGVSRVKNVDEIILDAGGLRVTAFLGEDKQLSPDKATFEIYEEDEEYGERILIIPRAKPGQIIRLNRGVYHIVSRYGSSNAIVRADITVEAGKLTEAQILHKAAQVTLKLVAVHGGEALADTSWTVLTKTGEVIVQSVGAFPSVVLTEGDYVAVADHDGQTFRREFSVETDINRDIEVLARR